MTEDPFERARKEFFGTGKTWPIPGNSASENVTPSHEKPVTCADAGRAIAFLQEKMPPTQPERERKLQHREIIVRRTSKWGSFGERVAKLKEGESIVLQPEGDPSEEACKIRSGLNRIRACRLVRRAVQVVDGRIVITRVGNWPMLSAFKHTTISMPSRMGK